MAFNYDDALSADRDKVRFHIQDTVSGQGPKPNKANFTDDEIDGLVTIEGSWQRAVAAAFESLAAIWARQPGYNINQLSNNWDGAREFRAQAKMWRDKHGYGATLKSRPVTRTDAYSDDVNAVEVS